MLATILALTISGTLITPDAIIIKAPDEDITILSGTYIESGKEVVIRGKNIFAPGNSSINGKYVVLHRAELADNILLNHINGVRSFQSPFTLFCDCIFKRTGVDVDAEIEYFSHLKYADDSWPKSLRKYHHSLPRNYISENATSHIDQEEPENQ